MEECKKLQNELTNRGVKPLLELKNRSCKIQGFRIFSFRSICIFPGKDEKNLYDDIRGPHKTDPFIRFPSQVWSNSRKCLQYTPRVIGQYAANFIMTTSILGNNDPYRYVVDLANMDLSYPFVVFGNPRKMKLYRYVDIIRETDTKAFVNNCNFVIPIMMSEYVKKFDMKDLVAQIKEIKHKYGKCIIDALFLVNFMIYENVYEKFIKSSPATIEKTKFYVLGEDNADKIEHRMYEIVCNYYKDVLKIMDAHNHRNSILKIDQNQTK